MVYCVFCNKFDFLGDIGNAIGGVFQGVGSGIGSVLQPIGQFGSSASTGTGGGGGRWRGTYSGVRAEAGINCTRGAKSKRAGWGVPRGKGIKSGVGTSYRSLRGDGVEEVADRLVTAAGHAGLFDALDERGRHLR